MATGNIAAGAHAKLVRAGLAGWFGFGGYGDDGAIRAELPPVLMGEQTQADAAAAMQADALACQR